MDGIQSAPSLDSQIYAMKKATDTQGQNVMKLLEATSVDGKSSTTNEQAIAAITGLGSNIDLKA